MEERILRTRTFSAVLACAAAPHHRPHIHAYYQDEVGIVAIDTIELIGDALPQRQLRLVEAWTEIHQAELLVAWVGCKTVGHPARLSPFARS
jgi:hypothetical protein